MEINKIKKAAEIAKSRTSDKRWLAAIDKAVAGVESGGWIITELQNCIVVTTEGGKTYRANEKHYHCESFFHDKPCKHRSLYRLLTLAESTETEADQAPASRPAPRIVRSVEQDFRGNRYKVVKCDGWAI
jgi:hypothetical protein